MKPRILFAESDKALCELLEFFFRRHDFETEVAGSGLQCLSQLRASTSDVLVLDLELLWGGGDGILARLREDVHKPVPVVLTTWQQSPQALIDWVIPPVVHCLRKPFRLDALLACISLVLASSPPKNCILPPSDHLTSLD
jgi:DNA-binding response OmpR family regulator